ncbi:hypothetical protein BDV93DRAFT_498078 [Ceratobasidium sp. AG-I]|nr:hypothetical protein BDV93DRAFT_498078 [Ceratobasidium sp. AG-I]
MLADVDQLPHGPDWEIHDLVVDDGSGPRTHYLCKRNPVDVVRELFSNPRFKDHFRYAPERHWTSEARDDRIYDEMWTGEWWWRTQGKIKDPNATIAGLILASDKTKLTLMCGGQQAYPVYITIGNISKDIRRKPKERATVLLGYLPIEDFSDVADETLRTRLKGQLIHDAMAVLLQPLRKASAEGVEMWCADGRLPRVYPIVAAFVGDFPEQNLMCCTFQSSCPICTTKQEGRADYSRQAPVRTRRDTLEALKAYFEHNDPGELKELSLKPWWPWWAGLPYVNLPASIPPDLLHQIYNGVFKERIMRWLQHLMGAKTLNDRFISMPGAEGLRKFAKGVTTISQWQGRESKQMLQQIVPISVGKVPLKMTQLVRSLVDFAFLAHASSLTDKDIAEMERSLAKFHELKPMMISNGYYQSSVRFDGIPKIHMLSHYSASIRELGTPDGYNTEGPEHLHIHYAKDPWRASNKVRPLPQMMTYVQRLDALRIQRACINAYYNLGDSIPNDDEWEDEDDYEMAGQADGGGDDVGDGGGDDVGDGGGDDEEVIDSTSQSAPESDSDHVFYPQPHVHAALRPTKPGVYGTDLIEAYGASELQSAVTECLVTQFQVPKDQILLSRHHKFDVWHRLYIDHSRLPFAPSEPLRRDVVRAHPATYDASGRVLRPARFDTALYLERPHRQHWRADDPEKDGMQRFHAGRVRATFSLPGHLQKYYSGTLAYLELFSPFTSEYSQYHGMYTTSPALHASGTRRVLVIPTSDIVLACHLSPHFSHLHPNMVLNRNSDLLAIAEVLFLNHYYNHHTFLLVNYWRRLRRRSLGR